MCECVAKDTFDSKQLNQAPKEESKCAKKKDIGCVLVYWKAVYV